MTATHMTSLDDKVVVITGAGSGIGRELALQAARKGALLAISDWNEQSLAETVDLLKAAGVRELRSDVVDVSDRAAGRHLGRRRRRAVRSRQHAGQQRRRHRAPATSRRCPTRTSTGSSASTSTVSSTAPRSSSPT